MFFLLIFKFVILNFNLISKYFACHHVTNYTSIIFYIQMKLSKYRCLVDLFMYKFYDINFFFFIFQPSLIKILNTHLPSMACNWPHKYFLWTRLYKLLGPRATTTFCINYFLFTSQIYN